MMYTSAAALLNSLRYVLEFFWQETQQHIAIRFNVYEFMLYFSSLVFEPILSAVNISQIYLVFCMIIELV